MKQIAIISDTHSYLDETTINHLVGVDMILHAGDIGSEQVLDRLSEIAPTVAVYGNIDDSVMRRRVPEVQSFIIEQVKVLMMHIGGYPGRYTLQAEAMVDGMQPQLFITGHSHILKVMPDPSRSGLLHINPGAVGMSGWQTVRTIVMMKVDGDRMYDLEVIEMTRH